MARERVKGYHSVYPAAGVLKLNGAWLLSLEPVMMCMCNPFSWISSDKQIRWYARARAQRAVLRFASCSAIPQTCWQKRMLLSLFISAVVVCSSHGSNPTFVYWDSQGNRKVLFSFLTLVQDNEAPDECGTFLSGKKKENEKRERETVKTSRVERELTTLSKNHLLRNIAYFTEKCTAIEAVCCWMV